MTERIDHVTVALDCLDEANEKVNTHAFSPKDEVLVLLNAAQVHATLALVEQQRIANLLAYAQFNWKGADDGRIFIGREGVMWCTREAGGRLGVPDD